MVHVADDDLNAIRGQAAGRIGTGVSGERANLPAALGNEGVGHGAALLASGAQDNDGLQGHSMEIDCFDRMNIDCFTGSDK